MTIWKAVYRRTPAGKQVMRHFHPNTKTEVERAIALDCQRSDANLLWSEETRIYLDAKLAEGPSQEGMGHADRASKMFIQVMGDIDIESTTPEIMKNFMQTVAHEPLKPVGSNCD